ncbi:MULTISPECIES: hypothetical protein [unclassified Algibacter]|uniref:hypothetical protein n=1 Tax=unclassified Algibacter TaxID=2615009 RepID=UPI00131ABAA8|nr:MULTISPECIES: hypothetical protein [unclassified Algibacter]MCL5127887.1 hypothetical protein [Algibacter sp. L4_22]
MDEFLLAYKFLITTGVEVLAAVTGLFFLKKYKPTAAKFFIYFLVYLTLCDFISNYPRYIKDCGLFSFLQGTVFVKNYWWTTLYWKIGAIVFFAFYYHRVLKTVLFKKLVKIAAFSFLLFSISYIAFNWDDYFRMFFPSISVFGAFIIFLCTVCYFIEVLKSDKILTFYKSLNFYISFAVFIWWLIITPLVFYDLYMSHLDWDFIFLRWQIYLIANVCMYGIFIFALIFCKPEFDDLSE